MRLGVAGSIVPRDLAAVDDRVAAAIAAHGFTGVGTHFLGDPETLPRAVLQRAAHVPVSRRARRSGNSVSSPSADAGHTPRSVMSAVTSRAGVTSKP